MRYLDDNNNENSSCLIIVVNVTSPMDINCGGLILTLHSGVHPHVRGCCEVVVPVLYLCCTSIIFLNCEIRLSLHSNISIRDMLVAQQLHNNADVSSIFIFFKNTVHISIVVHLLCKSYANNISLMVFWVPYYICCLHNYICPAYVYVYFSYYKCFHLALLLLF
jgi:hypothetical protein